MRKALLPDAMQIHLLVREYSGDGTLLPRAFTEICENIRDFTVVEHEGAIIGCGALHIYGAHLSEVRTIAVHPSAKGIGAGKAVVRSLIRESKKHRITNVCLFTRIPDFFARLGFYPGRREDLPDKIFKDCLACPRLHHCDEIAMVYGHSSGFVAAPRLQATDLVAISG